MIYKICSRCGKKYPVGEECPNQCYSKYKKENDKYYDKYSRKNKDIYHSKIWDSIRKKCIDKYDGICIYTLYKYGEIKVATMVHHIIELNENKNLAYEMDNLIPLCDEAHREIHSRYKNEKIEVVQEILRKYKTLYEKEYL